jgi:hypothetical protein
MRDIRSGKRPALEGAALCVLTVLGGWSVPSAVSAAERPLPAVAAIARAQPNTRASVATPSRPPTLAGAKEMTASAKRRLTTVPLITSTTVMGGGNPSTWPAARAKAPSLAGAYSPNLKTAFLALVRYSDWLGSHPNPNLVKNYVLPTSNIFRAQQYLMRQMVARGWHISPEPTEIEFIRVVAPPVTRTLPDKHKYMGGVIECVINEQKSPYLDGTGGVVGHTQGGGPTAYGVTLVQDSLHTQFYIDLWQQLTPPGDGINWERRIGSKR